MNPNQPGQMPTQNAQGQQNPGGVYSRLLQPGQISQLSFLSDQQKKEYQIGVSSLWTAIRENAQTTDKHQDALNKLRQFTQKMMTMVKQQQQQSQGQGQAANTLQQSAQRPISQGQPMVQQQPQQGLPASQPQQQPQQQQQPAPQAQAQQNQQQPQRAQAQQGVQQPQRQQSGPSADKIDDKFIQAAMKANIVAPAGVSGKEAEVFIAELRRRYAKALQSKEMASMSLTRLSTIETEHKAQGKPVPSDILARKQTVQQNYSVSLKFLENMQQQQREYKQASMSSASNGNAQPQNVQAPQQAPQQQNRPQPTGTQQHPQHNAQNNLQRQNMTPTAASPMSANPQQAQAQNMQNLQQPRPNMGAPQMQQQPNFSIPRPMSGQTGNNFVQGQNQSPQGATPNQNGPQTGPVPAFNHQSALQAARSHQPPQSQQVQSAQASATPSVHRPELDRPASKASSQSQFNSNIKNWQPNPPQPVSMPPSRPTMGGSGNGVSGMISQPAIQQKPEYNLHGSGDRVLDKKKLDELVRQVAGAGEGADAQGLQPDVEESILQTADEFIDNVVTQACRLAKARGATTLEVRDIQIILERYYNIRIPGFALDENRVVRKVAPAAPFLQKMNAVQAAKVMGGKTDV